MLLTGLLHAAEVKLLAPAGVRDVIVALHPGFERSTGNRVAAASAETTDVLKRRQGVVDLVILSGPDIDTRIQQGTIVPGSRVWLLKSDVGVCVRSGAPRADISGRDAVTHVARGQVDFVVDLPERRLAAGTVPAHGHRRRDESKVDRRATRRRRRRWHAAKSSYACTK